MVKSAVKSKRKAEPRGIVASVGGRGSRRAVVSREKSAQRELRPPERQSPALGVDKVRERLRAYADRGVFRGFSETRSARGLPVFSFVWMLGHPMELCVDAARRQLRFKQLLPGVPADSVLYAELKEFIRERHDADLPEHRRIDPTRGEASCSNRGGFVSLTLSVKNDDYAYGVNRIVNLVHELFVQLRDAYPDYLMENFDVPQE